jgi:peptidoglycan hydrolase CwlO-like protein
MDARQSDLESQANELASRGAELESRASELESRQAALESLANELESRGADLESRADELESREAALASLRAELDSRREAMDEQIARAADADSELADQLAQRQRQIDELQTQLSTQRSETATLQARHESQQAQNKALLARLDEQQTHLEELQARLQSREDTLHQRHHELNELQASINTQQTVLAERQERFDQREEEVEQLRAIHDQNAQLIHRLEAEIEQMRTAAAQAAPPEEPVRPEPAPETPTPSVAAPEPEAPATPSLPRFKIVRAGNRPVLDLGPNHVRTANGYQDERGQFHLFVDFVEQSQKTTNTWAAQVRYFRSQDGKNWNWIENPAGHPEADALDAYGSASPGILCASGLAMLFYAGRSTQAPDGKPNVLAPPDDPGHLSSAIMLATATLDEYGTPLEAFIPRGPVLTPEPGYGALRLDHPAVALQDNTVHLYYTAYDDAANLNRRTLGHATASLGTLQFVADPEPILAVEGGGQMPRVFRHQDRFHLFYHHFAHANGSRWQHYVTDDLNVWRPHDARLYNGIGGAGNELMVWTDHHGQLLKDPRAVVTGAEGGVSKLWSSRLRIK